MSNPLSTQILCRHCQRVGLPGLGETPRTTGTPSFSDQAFLTVVPSNHRHLVTNGPHRSLICKVPKAPSLPFGRQKTLFPWQQFSEISWVPLPAMSFCTTWGVAGTFSVILHVRENDPVGHTIGEVGDSSVTNGMHKGKGKAKANFSII